MHLSAALDSKEAVYWHYPRGQRFHDFRQVGGFTEWPFPEVSVLPQASTGRTQVLSSLLYFGRWPTEWAGVTRDSHIHPIHQDESADTSALNLAAPASTGSSTILPLFSLPDFYTCTSRRCWKLAWFQTFLGLILLLAAPLRQASYCWDLLWQGFHQKQTTLVMWKLVWISLKPFIYTRIDIFMWIISLQKLMSNWHQRRKNRRGEKRQSSTGWFL